MNEIEILKLCQEDKNLGYKKLFDIYGNMAKRTAYLICGNLYLADDIVQESFIQCFKNISKLKNPKKFKSWFYKIILRTSWKIVSKEKKNHTFEQFENTANIVDNKNILDEIESKESKMAVLNSINKLKFKMRTIIILYYFNQLTIKEISKTIGCTQGTIKSRLHNARKILKKELSNTSERIDCIGKKECEENV